MLKKELKSMGVGDNIIIHNRKATIIKKHSNFSWRLKLIDNNEIINIFYPLSESWMKID